MRGDKSRRVPRFVFRLSSTRYDHVSTFESYFMCVCVCVCVEREREKRTRKQFSLQDLGREEHTLPCSDLARFMEDILEWIFLSRVLFRKDLFSSCGYVPLACRFIRWLARRWLSFPFRSFYRQAVRYCSRKYWSCDYSDKIRWQNNEILRICYYSRSQ